MLLSIVIPVYNQINYTKSILKELQKLSTKRSDYQIIIVDDWSTDWTKERLLERWRQDQDVLLLREENKGTNYSWNEWVQEAIGEHVRIINNDIFLTQWLDTVLMEWLKTSKVSCPYTTTWIRKRKMPTITKENNIAWWCFMMKRKDRKPIPPELRQRYGDDYIYWTHNKDVTRTGRCHHIEEQSSDFRKLTPIIIQDKKNREIIKQQFIL